MAATAIDVAGDHDRWQPVAGRTKPAQQRQAVHSRQIGVEQQAPAATRPIGREKRFAARIDLDPAAGPFEGSTDGSPYLRIVIDDEDCRLDFSCRLGRCRGDLGAPSRGKLMLDGPKHLPRIDRLAQLPAVGLRDMAQGVGRNVASQHHDRDVLMESPT